MGGTTVSRYAKLAVAVAGAAAAGLEAAYPTAQWLPVVTAVATAVAVWAVPNSTGGKQ